MSDARGGFSRVQSDDVAAHQFTWCVVGLGCAVGLLPSHLWLVSPRIRAAFIYRWIVGACVAVTFVDVVFVSVFGVPRLPRLFSALVAVPLLLAVPSSLAVAVVSGFAFFRNPDRVPPN